MKFSKGRVRGLDPQAGSILQRFRVGEGGPDPDQETKSKSPHSVVAAQQAEVLQSQQQTTPPSEEQSKTPQDTKATTPQDTKATTPQDTKATTPQDTQSTTPQATQATTPQATQATTPQATQATTPPVVQQNVQGSGDLDVQAVKRGMVEIGKKIKDGTASKEEQEIFESVNPASSPSSDSGGDSVILSRALTTNFPMRNENVVAAVDRCLLRGNQFAQALGVRGGTQVSGVNPINTSTVQEFLLRDHFATSLLLSAMEYSDVLNVVEKRSVSDNLSHVFSFLNRAEAGFPAEEMEDLTKTGSIGGGTLRIDMQKFQSGLFKFSNEMLRVNPLAIMEEVVKIMRDSLVLVLSEAISVGLSSIPNMPSITGSVKKQLKISQITRESIEYLISIVSRHHSRKGPKTGFMMNPVTKAYLSSLSDKIGRQYFEHVYGGYHGESNLLGYPIFVDPFMPSIHDGGNVIIFGDFSTFQLLTWDVFRLMTSPLFPIKDGFALEGFSYHGFGDLTHPQDISKVFLNVPKQDLSKTHGEIIDLRSEASSSASGSSNESSSSASGSSSKG